MRLDKFLCDMGVGSRSDVKRLIRKGTVTVNGAPVKDPGASVTADSLVAVSGQPVRYESFQYYMMNKPAGIISASEDAREKTVVDLLLESEDIGQLPESSSKDRVDHAEKNSDASTDAETYLDDVNADAETFLGYANADDRDIIRKRKDLFPVGRLDRDTEGLLIITNDGQLAHQLLSPAHHIDKTYFARVSGEMTEDDVKRFSQGIRFDSELTALPAKLKILSTGHPMKEIDRAAFLKVFQFRKDVASQKSCQGEPSPVTTLTTAVTPGMIPGTFSEIEVTIQEGKFHQIKKMVEALGLDHEVLYLKRISMGPLPLDSKLKPGQARRLTEREIQLLRKRTE